MLYLHCGWARTSTTSLQAALFDHRERLAAAGVVFPEKWLTKARPTHYGLSELLEASMQSDEPFDEFKAFLELHPDRDVLFSAEAITTWLLSNEKQEALLRFLAAARQVVPTRCIWTLRRLDDGIRSLYLRRLALGIELRPPREHFEEIPELNMFFDGMCGVDEAATDVVYVKYDSSGAHNEELLRAFGIPDEASSAIREQLDGPRLNSSITHKQAVVLLNLDALSARAGVELDQAALRKAFMSGNLTFEEDWRCELVDGGARRALHERVLAVARAQGLAPYVEFFGDAEIAASPPVELGPDTITDEDLERLRSCSSGVPSAGP